MGKQEKPKQEKTTYQRVISGEIEPQGIQKGWKNLHKRKSFDTWDKDKLHAVSVKGGQAVAELHGERKTARQALEHILTLKITPEIMAAADIEPEIAERFKRDNPNATMYDLLNAVAVGKALAGNMRAYELVRDTHGDKPIERVEMTDNVTTESDRALMRQIADRLQDADSVQIVKDITADAVKTRDTDADI